MTVAEEAMQIINRQRAKGLAKYGKSLNDADPQPVSVWVNHATEGGADLTEYLTKALEQATAAGYPADLIKKIEQARIDAGAMFCRVVAIAQEVRQLEQTK